MKSLTTSIKNELVILAELTNKDKRAQKTKKATGRGTGQGNKEKEAIRAAIKQKIPFRNVISQVCDKAEKMPMIQLRDKKR